MLFLTLATALLLRIISLDQSLWLDEGTTALVSQMSLQDYFAKFAPGDFHPPLYYLVIMFWAKLFGTSEIALRGLSVVAGVGSVYSVYLIGKEIYSERVGLLSALFIATSGLHIYYSQEARMYALAAFFVCLAVLAFIRLGGRYSWIIFGISLTAAVLTHYLVVLMLLVFAVYVALDRKRAEYLKKYVGAHVFLGVGVLWVGVFLRQLSLGVGVEEQFSLWARVLGQTSWKEIFLVPAKFVFGRVSVENNLVYGGLVLGALALVGVVGLWRYRKVERDSFPTGYERLIWVWLILPFLISAVIGLRLPVFGYFRLLYILPAFCLLLGAGASYFRGLTFKVLVLALLTMNLVSSGVYLLNPKFHREDWRGAFDFIHLEPNKSAVVVFPVTTQHEVYDYYFVKAQERRFRSFYDPMLTPDLLPSGTIDDLNDQETVWLMRYIQPIFDPEDAVRQEVEDRGYKKFAEYDFNGVVVWKYTRGD